MADLGRAANTMLFKIQISTNIIKGVEEEECWLTAADLVAATTTTERATGEAVGATTTPALELSYSTSSS